MSSVYTDYKLLPVASNFHKRKYKSSLNDCFLVSVNIPCLSLVSSPFPSFVIGDVSNKLVSVHYIIHLQMKVKLIALIINLKHTA